MRSLILSVALPFALLLGACSSDTATPTPMHTADEVSLRVRLEPHPGIPKYTIGRVAGELGQTEAIHYVGNECWRVSFQLDGRETAAYYVSPEGVSPEGRGVLHVDPEGEPKSACEVLWAADER